MPTWLKPIPDGVPTGYVRLAWAPAPRPHAHRCPRCTGRSVCDDPACPQIPDQVCRACVILALDNMVNIRPLGILRRDTRTPP